MPLVEDNTPKTLRAYLCHGVDISYKGGSSDEALGECPFCRKKNKFSVNIDEATWRCFSCNTGAANGKVNAGGNAFTFMRKLHEFSMEQTPQEDYQELADDRDLLDWQTLVEWGCCKSIITGEWLVPGYNPAGKLMQLYRYVRHPSGKRHMHPTYGWNDQEQEIKGQLIGGHLYDDHKPRVLLTEGAWDAMVLWETLRGVKPTTSPSNPCIIADNPDSSLLSDCNILAVPSCNTFEEKWLPFLADKEVTLLYDSDHPRRLCKGCRKSYSLADYDTCPDCDPPNQQGTLISSPGYEGMRRASVMFGSGEEPPKLVSYLEWGHGSEAKGYDEDKPHGWDLRDQLCDTTTPSEVPVIIQRGRQWLNLSSKILPIPSEWATGTHDPKKKGQVLLQPKECKQWKVLRTAMQKAMHWGDGYDVVFSVMLASIASVRVQEDHLWVSIISPPGSGKSTLSAALSVARKWVYPRPHIRGVMSGYKSDKEGTEDFGLIPRIRDKTLLMKDADTLLKSPNLDKILAEFRDLFDGTTGSHYLQGAGRDYHNIRTTILLCGTEALRVLDDSELGQRFLTVRIMDDIDDAFEDDICTRALRRLISNKGVQSNGRPEEQQSKEMTEAMQLTGGYIDYLRKNMERLMDDLEDMSEEQQVRVRHMAKFVACMRARPSKKQKESQGKEMAARLTLQLGKLAMCLAIVLNKKRIDDEVMRRVRKVALDTSKGRTLDICHELYPEGNHGMELRLISTNINQTQDEMRSYIKFLREKKVGVLELVDAAGKPTRSTWRLTDKVHRLYKEIVIHGKHSPSRSK